MNASKYREEQRLLLQAEIDGSKTAAERNRLGQFATPTQLAVDILWYARELFGRQRPVHFLDPGFGTGSFFSALLDVFPAKQIKRAVGIEIDPRYARPATALWKDTLLDLRVSDFTKVTPPASGEPRFNLVICNPPYVRHHHIPTAEKSRLRTMTIAACGTPIGGLSGLYCYFLGLSHAWMDENAVAGWLIPGEFMDVNYGKAVKEYLLNRVTLLRIHRFDPENVQFDDALVSSAVVWFRKSVSPKNHTVEFSYGGTLRQPDRVKTIPVQTLRSECKWTRFPTHARRSKACHPTLGDFFTIKRGIATGDNKFFILTRDQLQERRLSPEIFKPILPSPRYLNVDEIEADDMGNPRIDSPLFLMNCSLPEEAVRNQYPDLWRYLNLGKPAVSGRYLCQHRTPWYSQEERAPAPFLCTYMGRGNGNGKAPFRFILNHSRATAANVYLLLYPKKPVDRAFQRDPALKREVWEILKEIAPASMVQEGRVYGGGLFKMEPKELAAVPVEHMARLLPDVATDMAVQRTLFE